jgi:hypothetical protein
LWRNIFFAVAFIESVRCSVIMYVIWCWKGTFDSHCVCVCSCLLYTLTF